MHIVHVIETLALASGGPAIGCTSLAGAQARLGHDVSIVCYDSLAHRDALGYLAGVPGFNLIKIETTPMNGLVEKITATTIGHVLDKVLAVADLVDIHGLWRPMLDKAVMLARRKNVAYAITPHGMLDPWSMRQRAWKKWPAWNLRWKDHCNNALFIRALNAEEVQLMKPLSLQTVVEILPNGVFPEEYADMPPRGQFKSGHPALNGRRYVLFLSRLHFKKGLDYLAEAFALIAGPIPDLDLVIVGPDDGALYRLQSDIKRLQLEERVHILGPLYGREKLAAIVDAECFCLPSRQEGFSIAIIEALAAGTPVVISENCHFPEVAQAGAGHVVPLNAEATASALIALLASPQQRQKAGDAGRDLILSQYTWNAIAERYIATLETLNTSNGHARRTA